MCPAAVRSRVLLSLPIQLTNYLQMPPHCSCIFAIRISLGWFSRFFFGRGGGGGAGPVGRRRRHWPPQLLRAKVARLAHRASILTRVMARTTRRPKYSKGSGRRAASQRRCLSPKRGTFAQPRRVLDKTRQDKHMAHGPGGCSMFAAMCPSPQHPGDGPGPSKRRRTGASSQYQPAPASPLGSGGVRAAARTQGGQNTKLWALQALIANQQNFA
jgi:hypothetical protein